jgi:transposase
MRFAGIDIAAETHVVAIVNADSTVDIKATPFTEDAAGYQQLLGLLGPADATFIAMEATGHYWKNLFAVLAAAGYQIALLNPLRTHRFAGEDLVRTKTDALDALGIARFAAQKRPRCAALPDALTEELRELVRLRERLLQDFGDRVRQLHRLVDLGFPEFTRYVRTLESELASAILRDYPTAAAFAGVSRRRLAALRYDGHHQVGPELARDLIAAARHSVGLIATAGDPAAFRSANAFAAYVGPIPGLKHSGKRQPTRAAITHIGNASLRAALWMPTLAAVRYNPWLRAHYERLRARGTLPKVAVVACMNK